MKNPWLEIPHSDYDNHMIEVGQAQVLNMICQAHLDQFKPKTFALLGCATGNGLEHVHSEVTTAVHAIDINETYLRQTYEQHADHINIYLHHLDIEHDNLYLSNVDLFFIGLVLEYVDPEVVLEKAVKALRSNGKIAIVIQKTNTDLTHFVSNTKYQSLKKLAAISNEVDEMMLQLFFSKYGFIRTERTEIKLTEHKSFISLVYNA